VGQREALANTFILYAPLAIGLVFTVFAVNAFAAPRGFAWFTLGLYFAGLALFLLAKVSLLRRGIRLSFGSSQMSPWNRRAYRTGYTLMVFGFFATLTLLVALGASSSS
jgi:hypothetical protein